MGERGPAVGLLVFEFLGLEKRQVGRSVNFVRARL
jgi:hypothetical protein